MKFSILITFAIYLSLSFITLIYGAHEASALEKTVNLASASSGVTSSSTERIHSGDYSSPAWISDDFKGSHNRTLTNNVLEYSLSELKGGFDTALAGTDLSGIAVDSVHPDYKVCSDYSILAEGDGFYWAGPKISVNWQAMSDESKGIWYENYIVDTATMDPLAIEQWIYTIHKGEYIGDTRHDGSVYKHYFIKFMDWHQYYAVRQNYRETGVTSISPIIRKWREHGMENKPFDGVKINIEFHGQIESTGRISGDVPLDYTQSVPLSSLSTCTDLNIAPLGPLDFPKSAGGGDLNPGVYAHPESMKRFQDMKVGLSVHWGPSALGGKEISWSRGEQTPKEIYDNYYTQFNPTKFDAQAWMDLMKAGGMKYLMLTSKHHDGFALWDSAYSHYDIANTPFKRDIVAELVDAAKSNDIVFGTYFSIIDWYHPDYQPYDHGGPGALYGSDASTPNFERYRMFMKKQLHELIVDYGAEIIQLDGEWDPSWNHDFGSHLYAYLRLLNPEVLINNRTDVGREHLSEETGMWEWQRYAGDFDERERMVDWVQKESHVFGRSANPWQAWVTIDQAQWSWNATPRLLSAEDVIIDLVKTIGDGGNYLINLGPKADGSFEPEQVKIVHTMGAWVKKHADGVYGTRAGPFIKEGVYTSTEKGGTVYLFVFNNAHDTDELQIQASALLTKNVRDIVDVEGNQISFQQTKGNLTLSSPFSGKLHDSDGSSVTMFKLTFN